MSEIPDQPSEDQERDEAEHPSWCAHRWPHPGWGCSGVHRRECGCKTGMPGPSHLSLGQLIDRLRAEPDLSRRVPIGFDSPHSYRGDYYDLAFEIAQNVTVAEMLASAESALGATFQGWKGGDYTMSKYTEVWLVEQGGCCGESLGSVLLALMLQDRESAYRAGREDEARNALIIRGDLDITTVVAALDRAESEGGDLGRAAGDLLRRLPTWMGSDGHYRPAGPGQVEQAKPADPARCQECAELGHADCYAAGRRAGREDAARSTLSLDEINEAISALSHCAGCGELSELGLKLRARQMLPRFEAALIKDLEGEDQDTPEGRR